MTVLKISKLQGFVCKTMHVWLDGKSCFPHTNASNSWQPLHELLLLLRDSAEILRLPYLNMLFQLLLCFFEYRKLITWSRHAKSLLNGTTIMIAYGHCKWWAHLKHNKAVFILHIAHLKEIPKWTYCILKLYHTIWKPNSIIVLLFIQNNS